jgi:hypothetical protein
MDQAAARMASVPASVCETSARCVARDACAAAQSKMEVKRNESAVTQIMSGAPRPPSADEPGLGKKLTSERPSLDPWIPGTRRTPPPTWHVARGPSEPRATSTALRDCGSRSGADDSTTALLVWPW